REDFRTKIVPARIEMYTVQEMDRNLRNGLRAALNHVECYKPPRSPLVTTPCHLPKREKEVEPAIVNKGANFFERLLGRLGCKKRSLPPGDQVLSSRKTPRFLEQQCLEDCPSESNGREE
ncbi:unnamed protein product, partial [Amoebophrya sp. A25]